MIAVICAMCWEASPVLKALTGLRSDSIDSTRIYSGSASGKDVIVIASGVGPEQALRSTQTLLANAKPNAVIISGVGGGISPDLTPGCTVIARQVQHWNGSALQDDPLECSKDLIEKARTLLKSQKGQFFTGPTISTEEPLIKKQQKRNLFWSTGGQSVDSESYWVAKTVASAGMPFVNVRFVLDTAADDLPAWVGSVKRADDSGISQALAHPLDWPKLPVLGLKRRAATRSMNWFFQHYLPAI